MPNMSLKKNEMPSQEPNVRNKNFLEVALGYTEEQALDEAARCLNCKNHPCVSGCPVQVKIPEFIKKITEKDYEGAYQVIHETSSLPAVCGRVCPQETQCESKCIRGIKGEPVGIGRLERFVADWHNANVQEAPAKPAPNGHKVAVIGSGPSGLTCAGDLAKKGYDVTVFEALHLAGGVLVYGIPEFRLPKAIVQKEVDGLKALGVKVETNMVIGRVVSIDELMSEYGFEAVFIGSGAGLPMFMHIPGENLCGVYSANEFLTRINLMKAYKDGSDTPIMPLQGKKVAVVGGGNVAMDVCRTAIRLGAKDTYIIYRRSQAEMPADAEEVAEAMEEGVQFRFLSAPAEILGENGKVKALKVEIMELGEPDAKGRRKPVGTGEFETLAVDSVIGAIGQTVDWGTLDTGALTTTKKGTAEADALTYQTAQPDIFVGGDCATGPKYTIDAIATGREGAVSIHRFVNKGQTLTIHRNTREFKELNKDDIVLPTEKIKKPARAAVAIDSKKVRTMQDDRVTFTEEQIRSEASRCLSCGRSVVDPNKCIGCGICTTKCEFDAIHLKRVRPQNSKMIPAEDKFKAIGPYAAKRQVKIIKKSLAEKKK